MFYFFKIYVKISYSKVGTLFLEDNMGQYFYPVIKIGNRIRVINPTDYADGLKLMAHSFVGNPTVNAVVKELTIYGPCRIAWVGNYSKTESLNKKNKYCFLPEVFNDEKKRKRIMHMWEKAWGEKAIESSRISVGEYDYDYLHGNYYLLNLDRKEYIYVRRQEHGKWLTHPLAILTCSNPGSGGNYHPKNEKDKAARCSWCGDRIDFSWDKPFTKDWTEISSDVFYDKA